METTRDLQGYSCILYKNGEKRTFSRKGVIDLFELLTAEPDALNGASVCDKAVGKGAAALMVLGEVKEVYTPLISTPALQLLKKSGISVEYDKEVPFILNRYQTDLCPLEKRCREGNTAKEMLPVISRFIEDMKQK